MWKWKAAMALTLLLAHLVGVAASPGNGDGDRHDDGLPLTLVAALLAALPEEFGEPDEREQQERPAHIERQRKHANDIFKELGPRHARRAHRMDASAFWTLHRLLKPHFPAPKHALRKDGKEKKNGAKNGPIPTPVRLSVALRFFAGGGAEDISLAHGISPAQVCVSAWFIVDAVNNCKEDVLSISHPTDHAKQRDIAQGFLQRGEAGFDIVAGAVDGMLVWMEKPSEESCRIAGCGAKKFMCGRKKKFGLNMQGTCDSDGVFLDLQLRHPASASDFLSFSTSSLCRKLEVDGFLADGLCLFGDSARCVNNRHFTAPFKSVSSGAKDDFNFFHSQVRIKIECAFGMFTKRWGILRRALPAAINIRKATALVVCLGKLHNCCIRTSPEKKKKKNARRRSRVVSVPPPLARDNLQLIDGVRLERAAADVETPEALLHSGEHHDDTAKNYRRQFARRGLPSNGNTPRSRSLRVVEDGGCKRKTPKRWLEIS